MICQNQLLGNYCAESLDNMELIERLPQGQSQITLDLHPVLKKIYATRGIFSDAELALELAELESPSKLLNISLAVEILHRVLKSQGRILVVGDFDADGATSCALSVLCLRAMGFLHVDYLVPNRFEYGYGLTPEIVEVAKNQNPDLIMTVDNGISSHEGIMLARSLDIDILVTDHHLAGDTLPDANCILNPNQPACSFPSKALAGVGVVFYLMTALRAELRLQGWFKAQGIVEPNMANYLDIVALGTVADVVPLDQNNRRMIKHGLKLVRSGRGRPGILALLEVAGRNPENTVANDFGFAAGPRLNAAGRLDDMSLGIECLLTEDHSQARKIAQQLDSLNKDRKVIEQDMQDQALAVLDKLSLESRNAQLGVCLYDPEWHQGVIGILASRIKDKFHRPAIVFADSNEDAEGQMIIKGSARSINGLHIRDVLDGIAKRKPELLSKFGGHAMAAGLAIRQQDFKAFLEAYESELQAQLDPEVLQQRTFTDGVLSTDCFNLTFAAELRAGGPWGQSFPEPLFNGEFVVVNQRVLGDKHLKLVLAVPASELVIDAIAFNVAEDIRAAHAEKVKIAYRLDVNEYRGNCTVQLMIQEIELP
jgi:single-stranded-DNA-specific exonuclease